MTTTVSARRDGRTAATVPDEDVPEPLGFWAERHRRQCDEFAAGLKEARKEKERALRGRGRPDEAGPSVRDLVRQVRAAERRIGLGRGDYVNASKLVEA